MASLIVPFPVRRLATLIIVPALVLSVVACGGSTAATSSPGATLGSIPTTATGTSAPVATVVAPTSANPATGTVDACTLLTESAIEAALGAPVGPAHEVSAPFTYDCQWAASDFLTAADLTVSDWTAIDASAHGGTSTPIAVSGVGDQAWTGPEGSLYVRKGDQGFLLLVSGASVDNSKDNGVAIATVLALQVLAKM